ncbi:MAG: family 10 glycosylhydrolase [Cyanobacteriota bacterium]|nr:family 10 glycosylhydrolase [Cyanobacteriota bacterium]
MAFVRVIAPAGVALRSLPSTTGRRLALLPEGTSVEGIQTVKGDPYDAPGGSQRTDWLQVRAGELEGFVAALWLEPGGQPTTGGRSAQRELRGVWICSHHHSGIWQSRDTVARAMDQLVELGWNTVFPAVWNQSFTAWPSAVMEGLGLPKQDPVYASAGIDPLQLVVELGKERGLMVIPWLEYGFAAEPVGASRGLLAAKPDWAARDRRGEVVVEGGLRWLNGLHPEVQAFVEALVLEVVERYGVDGVQGDDHMAIPRSGSHDPATLERYRQATGKRPGARDDDPSWSRFRIEGLSGWVKGMGERIHRVRPDLLWCLSPCPLPTGLTQLMQDSTSWLNNGSVDLLLPQLYRNSVGAFQQVLEGNLRPLGREQRQRVVAGLTLRANGQDLDTDTVLRMVQLARREGLGGVAIFHHTPLVGGEQTIARALVERGGFDQLAVGPGVTQIGELQARS